MSCCTRRVGKKLFQDNLAADIADDGAVFGCDVIDVVRRETDKAARSTVEHTHHVFIPQSERLNFLQSAMSLSSRPGAG
jgi:hypothetical protein